MAQVGVQQPSNLMEMFSSPSPMLWDIAGKQVEDQTLGNALNRAQAQQSMDFAGQEQPFKLSRLGLENQGLEADLPGKQAISSLNQDKALLSRNSLPEQQNAELSELATKISNNDLTQAENAIKTALTHPSAAVRQQAEAMWGQMSQIKELKLKHDQRQQELMTQGGNARDLMQQQIDAGRFEKANQAKGAQGIVDYQLARAKKASDQYAILTRAAAMFQQQGDMETALKYQGQADALQPAVAAEQAAYAKPGTANIDAVTNGAVPTNVAPSPRNPNAPGSPAASAAGQYTQGQTYKGRTGTYQYLGGDSANKNSWKKVD